MNLESSRLLYALGHDPRTHALTPQDSNMPAFQGVVIFDQQGKPVRYLSKKQVRILAKSDEFMHRYVGWRASEAIAGRVQNPGVQGG